MRIEPPGSIDPTRFAGDPPPSLVGHFRGRETELAEVTAMLESHRLVAVLGRAGAGKTMLISKLFESQTPERPLLRLSLLDRPGSLEQRFFESLAGSDDDARAHVRQPLPAADRLRALRRRRHDLDRVVVVLDDVQAAEDEARPLIDACVETDGSPRVIAASRRALTLGEHVEARYADRCAELVLEASLAEDDAREVIRALDPQGSLGLRDAPEELVRRLCQACHHAPRALETLAALLRRRRTLSPQRLADDAALLASLVDDPARQMHDSLSADEREVVKALAVFGTPVPLEALTAVVPTAGVEEIIETLLSACAVRTDRRRFWLYPIDGEHTISRMDAEARNALEAGAAAWWATQAREVSALQSLDDVEPHLRRARHLMAINRVDEAASVVDEVSAVLSRWGYHRLLAELRRQLLDRVTDATLARRNRGALGEALQQSGEPEEALPLLRRALDEAHVANDAVDEARLFGRIGDALLATGDVTAAIATFDDALARARETGLPDVEARLRGSLGNALFRRGRARDALLHHRAALDAARQAMDSVAEARWLGCLGLDHTSLGEPDKAAHLYQDSIEAARAAGDRRLASAMLNNLGHLRRVGGRLDEAAGCFEEAIALSCELGNRRWEAMLCANLGLVEHLRGRYDEARHWYGRCPVLDDFTSRVTCLVGEALLDFEASQHVKAREALEGASDLCLHALERQADDVGALGALTLVHLALGRGEDAIETMKRALAAGSDADTVAAMREELGLVRRAHPQAPELEAIEALLEAALQKGAVREGDATKTSAPNHDGAAQPARITTTHGTRIVSRREIEALRADHGAFELWVDEERGEVEQATLGRVPFANRRTLAALLLHLMVNVGAEFTTDDLLRTVWDAEHPGEEGQETVRVGIMRLRQLIEPDPRHPQYVLKSPSRFGRRGGYYFNPAAAFCLVHRPDRP